MEDDGYDVAAAIRALTSPLVLMERLVEEALHLVTSGDGATVLLVDGDHLTAVSAAGIMTDFCGLRFTMAGSLAGTAVRTGTTLSCDDASTDPRVDREATTAIGSDSVVCVPLYCAERPVGSFVMTATRPRAFSDHDIATLASLSSFISAAITAASDLDTATEELLSAIDGGTAAAPDRPGISAFVANVLHPGVVDDIEAAKRVEGVLGAGAFTMAYQPIVDVDDGTVIIAEALARFSPKPYRSPDVWFAEAWRADLGADLELAAVGAALADLRHLPAGCDLAVNISPPVVTRPQLRHLLESVDPRRVVVELTEHDAIEDYHRVRTTLATLRELGVRLAVDDTGAGFASLSHIIKLAPDLIKLDYELIHGIAADPVRRSLATAIVSFAADIGASIVAEGIETADELDVVRTLGIPYGQGYLLGRPGAIDAVAQDPGVALAG